MHRLADERELRAQVFRRFRPVRLVVGIEVVAEGLLGLVEHHREMGRLVLRLHLGEQLPQHVAEAEHGIDLQPVRLAGERRQRVIGAENVGGAVHQEEVVALLERPRGRAGRRGGGRAAFALGAGFVAGFGGGLCRRLALVLVLAGWHGANVGRRAALINLSRCSTTRNAGAFAASPSGCALCYETPPAGAGKVDRFREG